MKFSKFRPFLLQRSPRFVKKAPALHTLTLKRRPPARCRQLLDYTSAVTKNAYEKKVNSLLDFISHATDVELLQQFYEVTLEALQRAKNDRLWYKANLKLCNLWFKMKEYGRMSRILKELHRSCQKEDGTDDPKKGTNLIEVRRSGQAYTYS